MADYMLVHHEVKDHKEWKHGYDEHKSKRDEAGLIERHLFHDAHHPNRITILFEAKDPKRALAFAESADLREAMQKVGVVGKPEVHHLKT